ncbi:MAG: transketolase [Lachnospiraceae bacterium]|nr:transketolase [Lachnospiraceae bacterium]
MIEITKVKNRTWSMLGARRTFGAALEEMSAGWDRLFVMSADLKTSSGLDRFANSYPHRYLSGGIAEQNMVCVASGLASEGKVVFISSFSPFMTGRCYDQIRVHLGMMGHNVKLVGIGSGLGLGPQGNTHYGLDDVSLMCTVPNMTVIVPADCAEVVKATEAAYFHDGPVYLRLCGESNTPIINKEDYDYRIGKAIRLREGNDVAILASGPLVYQALKAAEILAGEGLSVAVTNVHTVKPLDTQAVDEALTAKLIVTVEENFIHGGLSSMVLRYLSGKAGVPPVLSLGVDDVFPPAGSYPYMLEQLGLSGEKIAAAVKGKMERRDNGLEKQ